MTAIATPAICKCGERTYPNADEARKVEWNGLLKCRTCHTFATDHPYFEGGEGRCGDCDIRYGSHR